MKKQYSLGFIVLCAGLIFLVSPMYASETKAPDTSHGKMMMEHEGMACTNCHGDNGPEGVNMGNHPKQLCSDCHHDSGAVKDVKIKKTSIARDMMLKHGSTLNCKACHGEGPKSMPMEHVGMDCQTCHVVEDEHSK